MGEIFPIAAGIALGMVALRIMDVRLRAATIAVMSVVFGVIATAISGEALISWAFVLIDIPLVLVAALATVVIAPRVIERLAHPQ
ncbi:MAG: hypothetical protein R3A46_18165 [Thermomicrobiales bacterium]